MLLLPVAALAGEDPAARAFRLAADFLQEGKPDLAADALDRFVISFPESELADDALYLRATVEFPPRPPSRLSREHAAGAVAARAYLERVRSEHPTGDRVADAVYLLGLTHLVPEPLAGAGGGAVGYDPDRARALFREVLEVHPGSGAEVSALGGSAVAEVRAGRPERALLHLEQLLMQRPRGEEGVRGRLLAADAWLRLGMTEQAMLVLAPLADGRSMPVPAARSLLIALQRLQSPGLARRFFRDDTGWAGSGAAGSGALVSMLADDAGGLHLLTDGGSSLVRLSPDGAVEDRQVVRGARCLFREPGGGIGWATEQQIHLPSGTLSPQRTDGNKVRKVGGILDVAQGPDGTLFVLAGKELLRFRADGTFDRVVAAAKDGAAVEVDRSGRAYVLDAKAGMVRSYLPDGAAGKRFAVPGAVDLAMDGAYHVYVLDGNGAFAAFGRDGAQLAQVRPGTSGADALRSPRKIAVETSGVVIVFDAKSRLLRRYR